MSYESLEASRMSAGGLTRWEVLHPVRNAFKAAFVTPSKRKTLLLEAESRILDAVG